MLINTVCDVYQLLFISYGFVRTVSHSTDQFVPIIRLLTSFVSFSLMLTTHIGHISNWFSLLKTAAMFFAAPRNN